MKSIFNDPNPWLSDLQSDESFVAALKRENAYIHEFGSPESSPEKISIPNDPNNIFRLKIRFADMVRGCSVPASYDLGGSCQVDDNTVYRLARLSAMIDGKNEIENLLYGLAIHIFLYGFRFGRYHFWCDSQKFNGLRDEFLEKMEREKILEAEKLAQNIPVVDGSVAHQPFDWYNDVRFSLDSSPRCSRDAECHHQDHDEHGASQHTSVFMNRVFAHLGNVGEYLLQEHAVLLQIKNNQTKWVRGVLRYSLLYLQEIRRIINEKLAVKIPDDIHSDLFSELQSKEWFVDPRTLIQR